MKDKPEMVLEHSLKNTGRRIIQSTVYNHNFLVLDKQPPGPDFSITFPFRIHSPHPPNPELARIRDNQFVYLKVLENQDAVFTPISGFSDKPPGQRDPHREQQSRRGHDSNAPWG